MSASSTTLYTEFKDMKNMSGDNFPILSPRKNRARVTARESARIVSNVICANGGLIYLDSRGYLCDNGKLTEIKGYEYDTKIEQIYFLFSFA